METEEKCESCGASYPEELLTKGYCGKCWDNAHDLMLEMNDE